MQFRPFPSHLLSSLAVYLYCLKFPCKHGLLADGPLQRMPHSALSSPHTLNGFLQTIPSVPWLLLRDAYVFRVFLLCYIRERNTLVCFLPCCLWC